MNQLPYNDTNEDLTDTRKILLVGQANVGKSVVFNSLTGRYVTVSNYPGTTVEIMSGKHESFLVVDTPGISGVIPRSEDEKIAFEMVAFASDEDILVHVVDAKNLKRSLLLSLTFAEAGLPMVIDLNMIDEAERIGLTIDEKRLEELLGCPVVKTAAIYSRGMDDLKQAIKRAVRPKIRVAYDPKIEAAITEIEKMLPEKYGNRKRFVAVTLLTSNLAAVDDWLKEVSTEVRREIKRIILKTQSQFGEPLSMEIIQARTTLVERLYREVVKGAVLSRRLIMAVGDPAFHPVLGYLLLLGVLYLMYQFVGVFAAGKLVDYLEGVVFGKWLLPWLSDLFQLLPGKLIYELFMGEYGLISMGLTYAIAIVFPIVTAFFLIFSLLEDSGYLPRLGVLLNNSFEKVGLNGKAVIPLVLGLGCGTMATLVTRVLDTKRERIIATLLLALGIPCSAQLGVILGFFSVLGFKAFIFFFFIIALQLILVGYLAARIIPGKKSAFLAELPPYRLPQPKNVIFKTYHRARWFIKEAVPLFLLGTLILFVADKTGVLSMLTDAVAPIFTGWLMLPKKTAEAFILGFLRRDYGAAGLFAMFEHGLMDKLQAFVSMIVITLFVPCLANFLVIIKERGIKTAFGIVGFVFFYAFLAGGVINWILRSLGISF
jgi:ferrous iron transport protein B